MNKEYDRVILAIIIFVILACMTTVYASAFSCDFDEPVSNVDTVSENRVVKLDAYEDDTKESEQTAGETQNSTGNTNISVGSKSAVKNSSGSDNKSAKSVTNGTEQENVKVKPASALTPDGNMTLVDDKGKTQSGGKQFITLVTKSGNYFYLIIDRDDDGEGTVHFLNQVDEADLLSLIDDKTISELESQAQKQQAEIEADNDEQNKNEKLHDAADTGRNNPVSAVFLILAVIACAVCAGYLYFKKKRASDEFDKDPDEDYMDEDFELGDIDAVEDDIDDVI